MTSASELVYMSAKQVAEYLDLNEKKSLRHGQRQNSPRH